MLSRLSFTCALGLVTGLAGSPEAWAQAQPAASGAFTEPTTPAPPAAAPAAPTPAEQPLPPAPPAPAAPAPVATPLAPTPPPADVPSAGSAAANGTAPPLKRTRFFATLQLGGGYFHATSGAAQDTRTFSGGTISGELAFGGRVGRKRNVALAAAFLRDQVLGLRSKDQSIDGDEPHLQDVTFALWAVGFLVDFAIQREPGLHFQAFAGVGALSASRNSGDPDDPVGLMASLAAGYDFKVSRDFAVGALLRATYAPLDVSEVGGTTVKVLVPALLFTASTR